MHTRNLLLAGLLAALLAGCQTERATMSYAASGTPTIARPAAPVAAAPQSQCGPVRRAGTSTLAGRVLPVSKVSDIKLRKGEVVLTFDDGPARKRTPAILDTLDRYGVKATFLMVGQMAASYPDLVREVARRGHTIGSHTAHHDNLRKLSQTAALEEIAKGERSVNAALVGTGYGPARFFRFPYLADTKALRGALASRGTVVLDVDIDSQDYHRVSADAVAARTLAKLRRQGRGIILFHDIHARTVAMLPGFLAALQNEGYQVVQLVPPGEAGCPAVAF
ncbi:polysaccharide deacetylase family protein [Acuticoccus kandeliae]|uniref:polysaccharide deacetylase family protein n=1 Tax=Acuticoccus kandeliae TaxID=2073160 RepID=UPI000D3EA85F|nr:polysaccharide deacetylase family protein [Acuticoccus kandeliae]